jgi:uncharacterized protein (TIGR00369 family)
MSLAEALRAAKRSADPQLMLRALPFAQFLDLRIEARGERLTCIMPGQDRLVGNRHLGALHGGATAGFIECAAILFLLWRTDREVLPGTIDFSVDFVRSAKVLETHAEPRLIKLGARIANVHVTAWQTQRERLVATGRGHFLLDP